MRAGKTDLGKALLIPFLFCLVVFAAYFYVGNMSAALLDTDRVAHLESVLRLERLRELIEDFDEESAARDSIWDEIEELEHVGRESTDEIAALEELLARVEELRRSRSERAKDADALAKELAQTEAKLADLDIELERSDHIDAKALFGVETERTPLFVECRGDGAWIMPEGKELASDAQPSAIRELITRAQEPGYLVFLVRPDGFKTFRRYLNAARRHNAQQASGAFDLGYEPIDADAHVVYPTEG